MIINRDIKIIEAILFASNEPVLEDDLKDKIREKNKLKEYLLNLKNFYLDRGINLVKTGSKWSFRTSGDLSDELTIFKKQKRRISRAALETLAIIAYQQPITRSEIEKAKSYLLDKIQSEKIVSLILGGPNRYYNFSNEELTNIFREIKLSFILVVTSFALKPSCYPKTYIICMSCQ